MQERTLILILITASKNQVFKYDIYKQNYFVKEKRYKPNVKV